MPFQDWTYDSQGALACFRGKRRPRRPNDSSGDHRALIFGETPFPEAMRLVDDTSHPNSAGGAPPPRASELFTPRLLSNTAKFLGFAQFFRASSPPVYEENLARARASSGKRSRPGPSQFLREIIFAHQYTRAMVRPTPDANSPHRNYNFRSMIRASYHSRKLAYRSASSG